VYLAALPERPDREALLRESIEKYTMAVEIQPDMHGALFSWGFALMLFAEDQEGDNREALLSEAVERFTKAIEIEPDDYEKLYNLCYGKSFHSYFPPTSLSKACTRTIPAPSGITCRATRIS
jgi:hypothetical protein